MKFTYNGLWKVLFDKKKGLIANMSMQESPFS